MFCGYAPHHLTSEQGLVGHGRTTTITISASIIGVMTTTKTTRGPHRKRELLKVVSPSEERGSQLLRVEDFKVIRELTMCWALKPEEYTS